ncbi:MAG: GDP-L-fucose synthase [Bacteroidia bacterium]|nr:GDP-L-fucose synthase [Bacteroidia bacterium]
MATLNNTSKIYITGHRGMVGTALLNELQTLQHSNVVVATSKELDLRNQAQVNTFFETNTPDIVILAAAKVGGIQANINNPAVFIAENLMIQSNVIDAAYRNNTKQFVFIGSSCIYPKECPQPMKEEYLLTGKLEPTNEGYAIAKIAGIKMLEGYYKQYGFNSLNLMPCNLYGPNDSFDLAHSHVLSALVKRFVDAKNNNAPNITLWGTGVARREFMHVHDLSRAILFMLENYNSSEIINIGWGTDVSIKELAEMIAHKVGYTGTLLWDSTKPDGMLRKCMDVSKMKAIGFTPTITLEQGVDEMINIYKQLLQNN